MANSPSIDTTYKVKQTTRKVAAVLGEKTTGKVKETAFKTLAHIGVGIIGGGLAAAVIGKPAFLIGGGLTFYGYYKDISWLAPLGLGMMASSHLVPNDTGTGVSGFSLKQETENAKTRLSSLKDSLLSKTYLDKIIKPKTASSKSANRTMQASNDEETTEGFGSVSDNLQALDRIEQQLMTSAMEIQNQNKGTQGVNDEINGYDEQDFSGF